MKQLIIVLILLTSLIGCEAEDNGCVCTKEYYHIEATTIFDSNGIPSTKIEHILSYTEGVTCQEEVHQQPTGGYDYFNIVCE